MVSPDSTTEESKSSFSDESQNTFSGESQNSISVESQKTLHCRSPPPGQATPPAIFLSESKSDGEVDTTPPPQTDHLQKKGKKKKKQPSSATWGRDEQQEDEEKSDGIREPPTKKKSLHPVKQDSTAKENNKKKAPKEIVAETVSTPLSSQQSSKKFARVWSPKDELEFFNGLLVFFKRGKGLPKSLGHVYDHIRNTLDNQYSNRQFADKVSRWKAKFRASENTETATTLSFRSTHEAAIYNVCKQLWGGQDEGGHGDNYEYEEMDEHHSSEGDAKNVGKASMNGKGKEKKKKLVVPKDENAEEEMQKAEDKEEQEAKEEEGEDGPHIKKAVAMNGKGKEKKKKLVVPKDENSEEEMQKAEDKEEQEAKEEEGEDEPHIKKAVAMNAVANNLAKPNTESGQLNQEFYREFCKETDAMVNVLRNAAAIKVKETQLEMRAMIQDFFNTRIDHFQLPNRGRINVLHSAKGDTLLSREKLEALEQKWREQHIRELEVRSRRLDLLQEECRISLEDLQAPVRSGRY